MSIKIKNLIEDVIFTINSKLTSSKYILKGKCKQCGQCCTCVLFSDENGYIKNEEDFKKLQKKYFVYRFFSPNGKVTNETEELEGAILFKCKHLKNNKCGIYLFRPIFCRDYPAINRNFIYFGGVTLDNCGYSFGENKKFKDYIKNKI